MPRLPSILHRAALTMQFVKNTRRDTSKSAVPATRNDDGGRQSAAAAAKTATHLLKAMQKYCACHTKRLLTRYETCWNVTKRLACHAKRGYATSETSKSLQNSSAIATSRGR